MKRWQNAMSRVLVFKKIWKKHSSGQRKADYIANAFIELSAALKEL